MEVVIKKLTDVELLQRANSFTTGRNSHMTLEQAYRAGHSPIRTQLFWVECTDIPLFVASQLVRSHVGVQFFQRSKRTDRGGEDFRDVCNKIANHIYVDWEHGDDAKRNELLMEIYTLPKKFDRYAPTNLAFIINAEALINMAHKRLCGKASTETRELMSEIKAQIANIDPALAIHLVPQCVFQGALCKEPKSCFWIISSEGMSARKKYFDMIFNNELKQ